MFIVEDNSCLENSNSYVDISYIEEYLTDDRLALFSSLDNEKKESALITATQYVDNLYNWKGRRKTLEQGLNWPRVDVYLDGFEVVDIPAGIKKAVCEAAFLYISGEDFYSTENDKEVSSERVEGAVAISYVNPKEKAKITISRFEVLDILTRPYVKSENKGGSSVGVCKVERV